MLLDQQGKLKIDDVLTAIIPHESFPYLPNSPNYAIPTRNRLPYDNFYLIGLGFSMFSIIRSLPPAVIHMPGNITTTMFIWRWMNPTTSSQAMSWRVLSQIISSSLNRRIVNINTAIPVIHCYLRSSNGSRAKAMIVFVREFYYADGAHTNLCTL